MPRCVIVGGADINNYPFIKSLFKDEDYFIFCDSGLNHAAKLKRIPNLVVGDFDSADNPNLPVETVVLPREKDWTDTLYGVMEGINRGFDDFLLVGVLGNRMDHSLGNIYILEYLYKQGKTGIIADDYSIISLIREKTAYIKDDCEYFSLVAVSGSAKGVNIKNAKYNLDNSTIEPFYQFAVSNEVKRGQTAEVSLESGSLLLIKVYKNRIKN